MHDGVFQIKIPVHNAWRSLPKSLYTMHGGVFLPVHMHGGFQIKVPVHNAWWSLSN